MAAYVLIHANLEGAILHGTILSHSELANLTACKFKATRLDDTMLKRVILRQVDLSGLHLARATLAHASLSQTSATVSAAAPISQSQFDRRNSARNQLRESKSRVCKFARCHQSHVQSHLRAQAGTTGSSLFPAAFSSGSYVHLNNSKCNLCLLTQTSHQNLL
jgi:uncharacterized protein YjbI with pentapeptide repeats